MFVPLAIDRLHSSEKRTREQQRLTHRGVLGALVEWRRERVVGGSELGGVVEGGGADVEVADGEPAVRVAEAEVDGQVVPELGRGVGRRRLEVEGGEDGGVDAGVELVGAVEEPEEEEDDGERRPELDALPCAFEEPDQARREGLGHLHRRPQATASGWHCFLQRASFGLGNRRTGSLVSLPTAENERIELEVVEGS